MKKIIAMLCLLSLLLCACTNPANTPAHTDAPGTESTAPDTDPVTDPTTESTADPVETDPAETEPPVEEPDVDLTALDAPKTPCEAFEHISTCFVEVSDLPEYDDLTDLGHAMIGGDVMEITFSVGGKTGVLRFTFSQKRLTLINTDSMTEGDRYKIGTTSVVKFSGEEANIWNWCVNYSVAYSLYLPSDANVDPDGLIGALIRDFSVAAGDIYTSFSYVDDISSFTPGNTASLSNGNIMTVYPNEKGVSITFADGTVSALTGGITEAVAWGNYVVFLSENRLYCWNGTDPYNEMLSMINLGISSLRNNDNGTIGAAFGGRDVEIAPTPVAGEMAYWAYADEILAYVYLGSYDGTVTETYISLSDSDVLYVLPTAGSTVTVNSVEYLPSSLGFGEEYVRYENVAEGFVLKVEAAFAPAVADHLVKVTVGERLGYFLLLTDTQTGSNLRFLTVN